MLTPIEQQSSSPTVKMDTLDPKRTYVMDEPQSKSIAQNSASALCSLAWRNLRYEVKDFSRWTNPFKRSSLNKVIIRRLTGHVCCRSLNGFMGPSGAGKTTLLNCLNGNLRKLVPGSELYLSSDEQSIPSIGFVDQLVHETIVGGLTVREILYYAFRFKNHHKDIDKLDEHINVTLKQLLLDPDVLSNSFEKCSGGEQKRIAIAQEMMSLKKPSFLFIDEPTTGLDSQAALIVMQCLRQLTSHYPITLMVSIHSPNDEIVRMFDQLYILAKGGVCIYAGPPSYLKTNLYKQLDLEIRSGQPPIEEYLKIACNGIEDENVWKLAKRTLSSENEKLRTHRHRLRMLSNMPRSYKTFSIGDFIIQLFRLCYIILWVDVRMIVYQLLCYTLFYIYMATVFSEKIITDSNMCYPIMGNNETCGQETERHGWANAYVNYQGHSVFFMTAISLTISSVLFTPLLKIFRNEHRNRWYSMATFYWSFIWIRFFEMTIFALVIVSLMYFPTKTYALDDYQMNWNRFGYFFYFIWLLCMYMQSTGQFLSLIFLEKAELSVISGLLLLVQFVMSSNYMINLHHMNIPLMNLMSDILGTKFIAHGLIYAFFEFDRCDPVFEINQKTSDFGIVPDRIFSDTIQIAINIIILRVFTFILMYFRFSRLSSGQPSKPNNVDADWKIIPLDKPGEINPDFQPGDNESVHSGRSSIIEMGSGSFQRKKSIQEIQFEEFSREKIIVGWRHLTLFGTNSIREIRSVKNIDFNKSKLILRDLNGQFRFGTLNALMGTSGAGKTSFLKVLNGRSKTRLTDETEIYLSKFTPARICYLTQEVSGHLWPGLTARQSLIYASKLKNSFETEEKIDHELIAQNLLDELDIADTADTYAQNCSGGQKKRLALALELTSVRMPNLICIDEPTSGLDSNSAEIVIRCLKRLVHRHQITIVASIHQPSTEILMLFDYCYVLARGGVCIYSGRPRFISKHLSEVPEINWTSESGNFPVEELVKCSCQNYNDPIVQKLVNLTKEKNKAVNETLAEQTQLVADGIQVNRVPFSLYSVWLLCCRYWIYMKNHFWFFLAGFYVLYLGLAASNRQFYLSKIAQTSGCISLDEDFQNVCNRTEEQTEREIDLTSNIRFIFSCNTFLMLFASFHFSLSFSKESVYFFNEHRNGWYSTGAYYLMKSLFEILPIVPIIIVYVYIINIYETVRPGIYWWMVGLFLIAILSMQSVSNLFSLLVTNVGSERRNNWILTMLTVICITYIFLMNMVSNFFNPLATMHYFYQMISYFNTIRWLHEALVLLQYGFGRCGRKQVQAVLYVMHINHDEHFYTCLQMLVFNMIFYRVLALLVLITKSNPMKNRRKRAERILQFHQKHLKQRPVNAIIPGLGTELDFSIKKIKVIQNNMEQTAN